MLTQRAAALFNSLERRAQQGLDEIASLRRQLDALKTENAELRDKLIRQDNPPREPVAPRSAVERGYPLPRSIPRRVASPAPLVDDITPVALQDFPGIDDSAGDSPQSRLEIDDAPSPQALLDEWYRRYTDTFFKGHTRPLKVGIHEDLVAREPWPDKLVRRALACYVHLPRYLKAVRVGAERVDLDGQPAGLVSEGEARHAHKKLESLQAQQQEQASMRKAETKKPVGLDHKLSELLAKHGRQ